MERSWRDFAYRNSGDYDAQYLEEVIAAAKDPSDPLRQLVAKSVEVAMNRNAGNLEHSLVAASELVGLILNRTGFDDPEFQSAEGWIIHGVSSSVTAALDTPEVPLQTIDELIDMHEFLLVETQKPTLGARIGRVRRHTIAGEYDKAKSTAMQLLPTINHRLCDRAAVYPNGAIGLILYGLAGNFTVDEVRKYLEPVFNGNEGYPGDSASYLRAKKLAYGGSLAYEPGLVTCSSCFGEALIEEGFLEEAETYLRAAVERNDCKCFLMPLTVFVRWLLAAERFEELSDVVNDLLSLARHHEDVQEAFWGVVFAMRALAALNRHHEIEELAEIASEKARRLDKRLAKPRWQSILVDQRREIGGI